MRQLTVEETSMISGGTNLPGILGAMTLGWQIGYGTGNAVNTYNSSKGRRFGASLFKAFN